jgi:phthalate 4,5-dioxygenase oxygenase subunit
MSRSAAISEEDRLERAIGNGPAHVDQTTFRSKANRDNAYLIDRAVQKTETFTGIDGINVQDRAIQESMGPICDRSQEHLGPADKGVIQMRRLLREAINTVRAGGTPAGVAPSYYDLYLPTTAASSSDGCSGFCSAFGLPSLALLF